MELVESSEPLLVESSAPLLLEVAVPERRESDSEVSAGSSPPARATLHAAAESVCSDGRDSGVEADLFTPPDDALIEQIVDAVEFYFSDESLLKDAFLLKHVRRNKEGFVSIKLISSFKRVKHICRDWRAVAYALRSSGAVQLNETGTKARRLEPLPAHDETITSRTVVAVNLPMETPTIASVSAMFGVCGDISSIRVLKPGQNVPIEVRAAFNKNPDIVWETVNCAVVEYDLQDSAKTALDTMATDQMPVIPIGKVSNKKKCRQEELAAQEEEPQTVSVAPAAAALPSADAQKKRRQRRKKNIIAHSDSRSSLSGTDGEWSGPSSRRHSPPLLSRPPPLLSGPPPLMSGPPPLLATPPLLPTPPPLMATPPPLLPLPAGLAPRRISVPGSGRVAFPSTDVRLLAGELSALAMTPPPPPASAPLKKHSAPAATGGRGAAGGVCPWVQRRKASAPVDGDRRGSLMSQQNVLRSPLGPDGTRGFRRAQRTSRPAAAAVSVTAGSAAQT